MEIKDMKELASAFGEFKDAIEAKTKSQDVLIEEKLNKTAEHITAKLEEVQKENAEKAASLEAAINRMPSDVKAETEEAKEKASKAVKAFITKGGNSEFADFAATLGLDEKTMRQAVDTDGGYLVQSQVGGIINGRVFETSPMRQLATVIQGTSNAIDFVLDDDEAEALQTTEEGARVTTGTPSIGKLRIEAGEIYAKAKVTQSMLDDVPMIDSWLANKIADKISRTENTNFVNGDGVDKARGILTYDAWTTAGVYQRDAIEQVNSGSNGAYTIDGLISLQGSLKEAYQPNAKFLGKRSAITQLMKLKDQNDRPIFNLDFKSNVLEGTIFGKQVIFADDMPAIGTGALSLAYGDFSAGYTVLDRLGFRLNRDPYSAKPFIEFYAIKRSGGAVTNFEAIKLHKLAN
jgi:HK97 family phage major capsid protein